MVAERNLHVICCVDWIVDLRLEGGDKGGEMWSGERAGAGGRPCHQPYGPLYYAGAQAASPAGDGRLSGKTLKANGIMGVTVGLGVLHAWYGVRFSARVICTPNWCLTRMFPGVVSFS